MPRELPRSLTVRPVKLQGRLEETRYKKSDDGLLYRHESDSDLWLVETKDGRRATLAMPRRGQGWTRDGRTTWLTNSPREAPPMAHKKRRQRPIRPKSNSPRRAKRMAAKKRKSKAVARPRSAVVIVNSPKRRAPRRGRRNPPALSVAGIIERTMNGALGGLTIVSTEFATRLLRGKALGIQAGTMLAGAVELGSSTAAGLLAERFIGGRAGERYGQLIIDAGFASIIRATAKQLESPKIISEVLGDDTRRSFLIRGRTTPVNGYVHGARMNGYVRGRTTAAPLNGYVTGDAGGGGFGGGG